MPSSLRWCVLARHRKGEGFFRGKNRMTSKNPCERRNFYEHTRHRFDRSRVSVWCLHPLRTLAGKQVGHRPEGKDACRSEKRRQGLCADQRLDRFQPPVLVHRGRGSCHRRHSGGGIRLGAGASVGAAGRHFLRCGHGLRRPVCLGQERRQVHGHAD